VTIVELLPESSAQQIPPLYAQEKSPDPCCFADTARVAHVKFFTTDSNWIWYVTEYDAQDIFFGLVQGFEEELGYFSLHELAQGTDPMGLGIERDLNFQPTPLSQLRNSR
jgi:Protein of unknown function (DUF2958)